MRIEDVPGLPPRARTALLAAGIETIAHAAGRSAKDLPRGVGEVGVQALLAAGWVPGPTEAAEVMQPQEEQAPTTTIVMKPFSETGGSPLAWSRAARADRLLDALSKDRAPNPALVTAAWDLALAFEQEAKRAEGAELEIHDGLRVRMGGEDFVVRTSFKPGEKPPENTRKLALVPVES